MNEQDVETAIYYLEAAHDKNDRATCWACRVIDYLHVHGRAAATASESPP